VQDRRKGESKKLLNVKIECSHQPVVEAKGPVREKRRAHGQPLRGIWKLGVEKKGKEPHNRVTKREGKHSEGLEER